MIDETQKFINYLKPKTLNDLVEDFNNYKGEDDPILGELCQGALERI